MKKTTLLKHKNKPLLNDKQIMNIQWIHAPKNRNAIRIGKYKDYWILNQQSPNSTLLVYTQREWDAFIEGVKGKEFDDLI
jgi:hypothetical protein